MNSEADSLAFQPGDRVTVTKDHFMLGGQSGIVGPDQPYEGRTVVFMAEGDDWCELIPTTMLERAELTTEVNT